MITNKIKYSVKEVWGTPRKYPECEFSKLLCDISVTKTITGHMERRILKAGIEMEQVI